MVREQGEEVLRFPVAEQIEFGNIERFFRR